MIVIVLLMAQLIWLIYICEKDLARMNVHAKLDDMYRPSQEQLRQFALDALNRLAVSLLALTTTLTGESANEVLDVHSQVLLIANNIRMNIKRTDYPSSRSIMKGMEALDADPIKSWYIGTSTSAALLHLTSLLAKDAFAWVIDYYDGETAETIFLERVSVTFKAYAEKHV